MALFKELKTFLAAQGNPADAEIEEALRAVRAERTQKTQADVKAAAPEALVKKVSWEEAVKICPRLALDHEAAMRAALRQGLPELLGMDAAAYEKQFQITLPEPEVEAIRDAQNSVGLYTPHFQNTSQALDVLINSAKIPLWSGTEGFVGGLRGIDPRDIPAEELAELLTMRSYYARTQRAYDAEQVAYNKAEDSSYSKASVQYTPDSREAPLKRTSALKAASMFIEDGSQFLNVAAQFMFIRNALDSGMAKELKLKNLDDLSPVDYEREFARLFSECKLDKYMPDTSGWTGCPTDIAANGGSARVYWAPVSRRLRVFCDNPGRGDDYAGLRPARGGFAS